MRFKVIEFFAGIGGAAKAFTGFGEIRAAFDINENARQVYAANFDHPYFVKSIENLSAAELQSFDADTWWLSAPCQPFTRRGLKLDDQDPRTIALKSLIQLVSVAPPQYFFLENVVGFAGSNMHRELIASLEASQFEFVELQLCPTELGIPNNRPRFYLVASRSGLDQTQLLSEMPRDERILKDFLDDIVDDCLWLETEVVGQYYDGLNFVDEESTSSNCFTSGYGKSLTKCGSYLQAGDRARRFSPTEVSKLLGFWGNEMDEVFKLPESLTQRQLWKLLGNSISVFVVRELLKRFVAAE